MEKKSIGSPSQTALGQACLSKRQGGDDIVTKMLGVIFGLWLTGCATVSDQKYELKFQPQVGQKEVMKASLDTSIEAYENGKLKSKTSEKIEFQVFSRVTEVSKDGVQVLKKVLNKKGDLSLRELGFPEEGETMKFKLGAQGQVLNVLDEEPGSIFYLPFFILPGKSVGIGEAWNTELQWNMLHHPYTMLTKVESKLASQSTYKNVECFKIEFNTTSEALPQDANMNFQNSSTGYYLWEPKTSRVLYAETNFLNTLSLQNEAQSISRSTFKMEGVAASGSVQ